MLSTKSARVGGPGKILLLIDFFNSSGFFKLVQLIFASILARF